MKSKPDHVKNGGRPRSVEKMGDLHGFKKNWSHGT